MLAVREIAPADFEQADRRSATIEIALRRRDQSRQKRRAHHLHVFADRVGQAPVATTKGLRLGF